MASSPKDHSEPAYRAPSFLKGKKKDCSPVQEAGKGFKELMAYFWALDPRQKLWREAWPRRGGRQGNELKVKSITKIHTFA